ncbi:GNAT family N-acetyltransferase [Eisenibacter elegans]|jgi:RimJ/RimL family protein N-acetyltransferase|uniref:GNAT family N-acetyltransferase n=1 Tax=Eisenibacter elegans TaxID=997 RepID=UPI0003F66603|nr:GNAT family N-acetyltransferase [Eisenibacter elegans]
MHFNLQPILRNERVTLMPLQAQDFEEVYSIASDALIWEQHPNKNRWQRPVFETFFEGAMQSGGAFKIVDTQLNASIGSTRIYDYNPAEKSILIGYTFFHRMYWGKGFNHAVKTLMLDYLFQYVEKVGFHIGAANIRSQKSIERLGAVKMGEQEVAYFGEAPKLNFIYHIQKTDWLVRSVKL